MNANTGCSSGLNLIIKRALEGRITPLLFLLVLGFFSSLALLYISLHVYFFNLSNDIATSSDHVDALMETNVRLMASYNELTAPARIIPMALELGMRPGTAENTQRLVLLIDGESIKDEYRWASTATEDMLEFTSFNKTRTE